MEGGATGMSKLVTALQSILTTDAFMGALTDLIPVVGGVLLFAFVYRIVRRMIKGTAKGKANI
jgi:uncharacterized membrane protein